MTRTHLSNCIVGCELTASRFRVAVLTIAEGHASDNQTVQPVRCADFAIPVPQAAPHQLPPASEMLPLFKSKMTQLGIGGGIAAVALRAPRIALRSFVGPDGAVLGELQQATARSVNYVQFGLGDRVVGQHVHRIEDGRMHGLLGVTASSTVDPLVSVLDQVGLEVRIVEPAAVALTRIASLAEQFNDHAALMVLIDEGSFDLAAVRNGQLIFNRHPLSCNAPGSHSETAENYAHLVHELEKTARHYQRTFSVEHVIRDVFVHASDEDYRALAEALPPHCEFKVKALDATAAGARLGIVSGGPQFREYAVAIGAAAGLSENSTVVGPNLTSQPETSRPSIFEPLFRTLLWPTVVIMALWAAIYFVQSSQQATLMRLRVESAYPSPIETKFRQLSLDLTHTEELEKHLSTLWAKHEHRRWAELVDTIRYCVDDGLWLTNVHINSEGMLIIQGSAQDEGLVYEFREHLETAPSFDNTTITATTNVSRGSGAITEFSLECRIATHAAAAVSGLGSS